MEQDYGRVATDAQWELLERLIPPASRRGRPRIDRRRIVDAIWHVVTTGCQWRRLPAEFPNWKTVYNVFWHWSKTGVWQRLHDYLREQLRRAERKQATPSAVIVDSQSVRSAEGGEHRGFDAGKRVSGRKRHLAVDTLGLIWSVVISGADWQDQDAGHLVIHQLRDVTPRLKVIFADSAYARSGLPEWVRSTFGWILQTVLRPVRLRGFVVLPKRWIIERTFAWLSRQRRLARDYERTLDSCTAMIHIAMIRLMSRRLTPRY